MEYATGVVADCSLQWRALSDYEDNTSRLTIETTIVVAIRIVRLDFTSRDDALPVVPMEAFVCAEINRALGLALSQTPADTSQCRGSKDQSCLVYIGNKLTWPVETCGLCTGRQGLTKTLDLIILLKRWDQEHGGLVEFVVAACTPLHLEERIRVPIKVDPREQIEKECSIVCGGRRGEVFCQTIGRGAIAMVCMSW